MLAVLYLVLLPSRFAAVEATPHSASPIFAIGDLHGDHSAFLAIVRAAGLVDNSGSWIGGNAVLVQTGDVPDRGPDSLLIVRDLMRLQREAEAAGGRVVTLIGNHEAMNVTGDLRYVDPGEYAAFRDSRSEDRRNRFYRQHRDRIESATREHHPDLTDMEVRQRWIQQTPLGQLELLDAWGPEGEIGEWLAGNPAVALVDGVLFVHGGISDAYAALPVDEINERAAAAIAARDASPDAIINDPDGPLWYRGYFMRDEQGERVVIDPGEAETEVERVLAAYGARRIVVGHTPSLDGIRVLLGGKLIAIDTGISAHYGGARSYLELRGDDVETHIVEGREE